MLRPEGMTRCLSVFMFVVPVFAQQHDLLLKGGRLIDPKNNIDARMDVAVRAGKVSAVAPNIDASTARRTLDVSRAETWRFGAFPGASARA